MEIKVWWRMVPSLVLVALAALTLVDGEPSGQGAAARGQGAAAWGQGAAPLAGDLPLSPLRTERAAKDKDACRYTRGAWGECDSKTNMRTRKLTLKKGDPALCQHTKTIQKKCKKSCRYEKTQWSECNAATGEMYRTDKLKANSDQSCDQTRRVARKCNNKQPNALKDKGRRNRQ